MINNTDNRKLDELVKQTLSNYEAPNTSSDWAKMETLLDAAPKSNPYKSPVFDSVSFKKVVLPYSIIALVMIGGGYLIYALVNSTKTEKTAEVSTPAIIDTMVEKPVEKPVTPVVIPAKPIVKADTQKVKTILPDTTANKPLVPEKNVVKTIDPAVIAKEKALAKEKAELEKKEELAELKKAEKKEADKQNAIKKEKEKKEKEKKEKEKKEREKKEREKKEKEKIPKETPKKSNNSVGLNSLFLRGINADSVKKFQDQQSNPPPAQQPKDSVKTQ